MKFWLTIHWPPEKNDELPPRGVWVRDGQETAGNELRKGDCVLIYQVGKGPVRLRKRKDGEDERIGRRQGKQGIVVIVQAQQDFGKNGDDKPTHYVGRKPVWWRWGADTELISKNGFVSVHELNKVLGFRPKCRMRSIGKKSSGLKEITEAQYDELVRLFRNRSKETFSENVLPIPRRKKPWPGASHPESDDHKFLKEFVASNPAAILKERGLKTLDVEFPFDSGDRADIVLEDHVGRFIGVEIEVTVDPTDVAGILQAIKYRHMLAFVKRCGYEETRSFLVAYAITEELQNICKLYSVECFIISREDVLKWKSQGVIP